MSIALIFVIIALVFFALAFFNVSAKFNLVAGGLFFTTLAGVVGLIH